MLDHSGIALLFHERLSIMQSSFFTYLDRRSYHFSVAMTLVLFVLTLMMTFWAPPALTLDMRAFKALPENEAGSLHDFYYFYHLSYYSENYAMESDDLADTKQFSAASGNRDFSKLKNDTLIQFPQDLKNRLQRSSRSTSLNFALASSAIASICIYILVNLAIINWCAELCVAILRRSGTEMRRASVTRIKYLRNFLKEWTAIPIMVRCPLGVAYLPVFLASEKFRE
ncbi:1501190e-f783-4af1-80d7-90cf28274988-CDS [Sclerotinia trifoliorum]|uniref:1501190e-f783-4af1-80d7-90cf28274988-CDS n=1 Tax=Sclerotinia trifoliorum TaxID=28548 RepID=A0A8H2VTB2_9HELO|nr:1501190e-f783-4af1-80d7-90cf28274988-CDS [Sclerotinia trifoliorum]